MRREGDLAQLGCLPVSLEFQGFSAGIGAGTYVTGGLLFLILVDFVLFFLSLIKAIFSRYLQGDFLNSSRIWRPCWVALSM